MDYHDDADEAEEAIVNLGSTSEKDTDNTDEKLLDIENDTKDMLINIDTTTDLSRNGILHDINNDKNLEDFFENLILDKHISNDSVKQPINKIGENDHTKLNKDFEKQKITMDIFGESNTHPFHSANLSSLTTEGQDQQSFNLLASESTALLDDILNDKEPANSEWEHMSNTFLPPNILKQSLGDATLGIGKKETKTNVTDDKVSIFQQQNLISQILQA